MAKSVKAKSVKAKEPERPSKTVKEPKNERRSNENVKDGIIDDNDIDTVVVKGVRKAIIDNRFSS